MRSSGTIRTSSAWLVFAAITAMIPFARSAAGATLDVTGTVTAAGLDFGTIMAYDPFPIYPFGALDSGSGAATGHAGFASLVGVDPADLTITFGDLERIDTTFSGGCTPTPAANCAFVSNHWGNSDAGTPYFNVSLLGTGTILTGTIQSWTTTTDTTYPGNPNFGQGSGTGSVLFIGGLEPYLNEVLALTGGTGIAQLGSSRFNAVCSIGGDPCPFSLDATLTFVPEPTSSLLVGLGLAGLAVGRRTRL